MKLISKALSGITLIILFVFLSANCMAQYPGMGAFRVSQNAQFMNQLMQNQMRTLGMNISGSSPEEYSFQIIFPDSTKKEVVSAIYTDSKTNKKFIVWVDKSFKKSDTNRFKKIYPSQTLSIAKIYTPYDHLSDENPPVKYMYGRAADSCWLFNIKSGAISLYSNLCEEWDERYAPKTIVGIQLNDNPVIKFNPENLKKLILQDLAAMKDFDKKKYFKAIEKFNKDVEKGL